MKTAADNWAKTLAALGNKRFYDVIGDNLRRYRLAAHYTQEELAEKLDINPRTYQRYEEGERFIPLGRLRPVCVLLNCHASDVMSPGQPGQRSAAGPKVSRSAGHSLEAAAGRGRHSRAPGAFGRITPGQRGFL